MRIFVLLTIFTENIMDGRALDTSLYKVGVWLSYRTLNVTNINSKAECCIILLQNNLEQ